MRLLNRSMHPFTPGILDYVSSCLSCSPSASLALRGLPPFILYCPACTEQPRAGANHSHI